MPNRAVARKLESIFEFIFGVRTRALGSGAALQKLRRVPLGRVSLARFARDALGGVAPDLLLKFANYRIYRPLSEMRILFPKSQRIGKSGFISQTHSKLPILGGCPAMTRINSRGSELR